MPSDNAEVIAHDTRACGHSVKKQPVTCREKPLSPGEKRNNAAEWENKDARKERASSFLLIYISKLFNT